MLIFDDYRVGRMTRNSAERFAGHSLSSHCDLQEQNGRFRFELYQYPIVLAWAVAIPSARIDKAVIDLGKSMIAHGQAYVVLSRVKESCRQG